MKSLALSLLLFVSSSAGVAPAQFIQPKLEESGLAVRVKSVETGRIEYAFRDGRSVESKRLPILKTTYDEQGRKVEQVSYNEHGSLSQRLVYTFDAVGRGTGYEEYNGVVDRDLGRPRRHIYTLDDAGRTIEYVIYDSDGTAASRFVYTYDPEGRKTEEAFYSWQGRRTSQLVYTYDARGNVLTQTAYDAGDAVSWKRVNVYDPGGQKTESAQYEGETLRYRFFYKYDAKGRVKEQETREFNAVPNVIVSHAPEPGKVVYTYDDRKRTKEVATYNEYGTLKSRLLYASDEKGNDAGVTDLNADGSPKRREIYWYDKQVVTRTLTGVPSVEFVYDPKGNWTRRTFLLKPTDAERPEPYMADYREIVYY